MKYVYSSPDSVQVGLIQGLLTASGIPCVLRNQAVSQAAVGIPFEPEVWVLNDEDYDAAQELIHSNGTNSTEPP